MNSDECFYTAKWQLAVTLITTVSCFVASIICFYFGISILSRKFTRKNTFNLYVVFLILPDGLNTFVYALVAVVRLSYCEGKAPPFYEDLLIFINVLYYFSNIYLNCCLAYELYSMVERSHRMKRSKPPSMKRLFLQVLSCYLISFWLALWLVLDVSWSYYNSQGRYFGSTEENALFSSDSALAFIIVMITVPVLFVVGIRLRLWYKKMMPKTDRTRTLYVFFSRIIIIFIVMYYPNIVLQMSMQRAGNGTVAYYCIERTIHMITALQAFITLWMVSSKDDIRKAATCHGDVIEGKQGVKWDLERCDKSMVVPGRQSSVTTFLSNSFAQRSMSEFSERPASERSITWRSLTSWKSFCNLEAGFEAEDTDETDGDIKRISIIVETNDNTDYDGVETDLERHENNMVANPVETNNSSDDNGVETDLERQDENAVSSTVETGQTETNNTTDDNGVETDLERQEEKAVTNTVGTNHYMQIYFSGSTTGFQGTKRETIQSHD